jgi:mono/diheme cytochrome c family protein
MNGRQRMQWYGLGIMVVWCTILGMVLAAEPQQMSPGETVRVGHHYFVRYCSACHGVEGRGDGPAAPALQMPPADLTRIAQRRGGHFPITEITAYIDGRTSVLAHGRREMPIWGERFGEVVGRDMLGEAVVQSHLRFLIAYLQAIQQ